MHLLEFIIMTRKTCQLKCEINWTNAVERINAKRGIGLNKLRTYKLFKTEYKVEKYVLKVKAVNQRSTMSRFRCGVAPINLEIGRFFNIPK